MSIGLNISNKKIDINVAILGNILILILSLSIYLKERIEGGKQMKKKLKGTKGITLIALVLTIIVLLILAGVTIATLTGENGILSQAQVSKDSTERAEEKERIQLEVLGSYENDGTLSISNLKSNIYCNRTCI